MRAINAPPNRSERHRAFTLTAADFRRGAVFFVRRCGQTRRSCCLNQLVSPRAVLIYGALARLLHDVTGDRPTIKRTHKKRNTPLRHAPLKRTLYRRISRRPAPAHKGAERKSAQNRRVLSISDKAKGLFSAIHDQSPPTIRARLRDLAACAAVRRSFPQNQQSSCPTPFV